ncbi:MAG: hypothetical protein ACXWP5_15135, partial [Bdellovibrionota bacterium]
MPKLREWLTKDRALWLAITIGVLLNVVTLWNAALAHRPLFLDGAVWMFRIFSFGKVVYDPDYTRYLDTLLQLPGIWWIRAYGTTEDVTRTAMHLIELAYSLHPFLSLLACAAILRKKGRIELLIFPLLSFALVTQTTMAFHIGVVPDALSCFWPLFLLVILQEGRQDLPAIAALSLAL